MAKSLSNRSQQQQSVWAMDEQAFQQVFAEVKQAASKLQIRNLSIVEEKLEQIKDRLSSSSEQWEIRTKGLNDLRTLVSSAAKFNELESLLRPLDIPIQSCITDLRSSVVREACITVAFLAFELGSRFEKSAEFILPSLLSLIPNSVKVMSTSGSCAIRILLDNVHSHRLIGHITVCQSSKSAIVRKHSCDLMNRVLSTWDRSSLERQLPSLSSFLKKGISDPDSEARAYSRSALQNFKKSFPKESSVLIASLDPTQRKQLEGGVGSTNASRSNSHEKLNAGGHIGSRIPSPSPSISSSLGGCSNDTAGSLSSASGSRRLSGPAHSQSLSNDGAAHTRPKTLAVGTGKSIPTLTIGKPSTSKAKSATVKSSGYGVGAVKHNDKSATSQTAAPMRSKTVSLKTQSNEGGDTVVSSSRESIPSTLHGKHTNVTANSSKHTSSSSSRSQTLPKPTPQPQPNAESQQKSQETTAPVNNPPSRIPSFSAIGKLSSAPHSRRTSTDSLATPLIGSSSNLDKSLPSKSTLGEGKSLSNRNGQANFQPPTRENLREKEREENMADETNAVTLIVGDNIPDDVRSTNSGFAATYAQWTSKAARQGVGMGGSEKCYPVRSAIIPQTESYWSWTSAVRLSRSARQSSSEASSEASYASSSSRPGGIICQNFEGILAQLNSPMASERKHGLTNYQRYIRSGLPLEPFELRTVMDTLLKIYSDPESKLLSSFMDAIQCTVKCYHYLLHEWLHSLLSRTMSKYASEVLQSNRKSIQETLHVLRSNFPLELQFHVCCTCVLDLRQSCNTRLRACLLDYMKDLLLLLSPHVMECPSADMRMAVMKVIAWTGDQKSGEIRRIASRMVVKLFDLNTTAFLALVGSLPVSTQEASHRIIRKHISACEQDMFEHEKSQPNTTEATLWSVSTNASSDRDKVFPDEEDADAIIIPSGIVSGKKAALWNLNSGRGMSSTVNGSIPSVPVPPTPPPPPQVPSSSSRRSGSHSRRRRRTTSSTIYDPATGQLSGPVVGHKGEGAGLSSTDEDVGGGEDSDDYSLVLEKATLGVNLSLSTPKSSQAVGSARKKLAPSRTRTASGTTSASTTGCYSMLPTYQPSNNNQGTGDNKSTDSGIQNSVPDVSSGCPTSVPLSIIVNDNTHNPSFREIATVPSVTISDSGLQANSDDLILAEILHELSNHNCRYDQRRACLLRLIKMLRDNSIESWNEHFKPTLLLLLETLSDKQASLRALAMRVLHELLTVIPDRFYDYLHLTVVKILEAFQDVDRAVVHAAERCCRSLSKTAPTEWSISVLVPIIHHSSPTLTLAALHFQRHVIRSSSPDLVEVFLPEVTPDLVELCFHQESAIRKECVFCFVEIYFKVGEHLWSQIKTLNKGKIRLIKFYIEKHDKVNLDMDGIGKSETVSPRLSDTCPTSAEH